MRLYLVRHGEAKPKEEDPERHLTLRGLAEAKQVAKFLKPLGLKVDAIWHSGKPRAAETAEAIALAVRLAEGLEVRSDLAPEDDVLPVAREIQRSGKDIMIVGHLPFLDCLASQLLVKDAEAELIEFRKGAVVCLDYGDDRSWRLAWMITPEIL